MKKILGIKKGDWKAIAFCVFAAVTFWFFNAMSNDYSIDVVHPLEIVYDEEQYIPLADPPKYIRFSSTATGWDLLSKTSFISSSPVEIDLAEFKKKKYLTGVKLQPIVQRQMRGIKINYIIDDTIFVNFDKLKQKKISLTIDSRKILLAENYKLAGSIVVNPSSVVISGPASLVNETSTKVHLKIPSKDISGSYEEEIPVSASLNKLIKSDPEKVKVKFQTIQLEKKEKEIEVKKINFPKKKKIKLSDEKVVLTYFAKEEDVERLEDIKLEVVLDYDQLNEKNKSIKPFLKEVPEAIQKYSFSPAEITVTYGE